MSVERRAPARGPTPHPRAPALTMTPIDISRRVIVRAGAVGWSGGPLAGALVAHRVVGEEGALVAHRGVGSESALVAHRVVGEEGALVAHRVVGEEGALVAHRVV